MLLAIEGVAGSGKSTVRDRLLDAAGRVGLPLAHVGQFSWLSLAATRVITEVRAGRAPSRKVDALAAVSIDLQLHAQHNIAVAQTQAHVVADRLLLSTACLLALIYGDDPDDYLKRLAQIDVVRPALTIVLSTPPEVTAERLNGRRSARRFGDEPDKLAQLGDLYQRAADVWRQHAGAEVLVGPSTTPNDADRFVAEALARLRAAEAPPG
jgi:dTMP kinase